MPHSTTVLADAQAQTLWAAEPELINELVAIVQAEGPVDRPMAAVPDDLRCLALRALAVQMSDRGRGSMVIASLSSRTRSGALSTLLNRAVASFVEQGAIDDLPDAEAEGRPAAASVYSADFVDAMLSLVQGLIGSSQVGGCIKTPTA